MKRGVEGGSPEKDDVLGGILHAGMSHQADVFLGHSSGLVGVVLLPLVYLSGRFRCE